MSDSPPPRARGHVSSMRTKLNPIIVEEPLLASDRTALQTQLSPDPLQTQAESQLDLNRHAVRAFYIRAYDCLAV